MPDLGTLSFLGAEPVSFSVRVFGAGSLAKPYRVRAALKSREKWSFFAGSDLKRELLLQESRLRTSPWSRGCLVAALGVALSHRVAAQP